MASNHTLQIIGSCMNNYALCRYMLTNDEPLQEFILGKFSLSAESYNKLLTYISRRAQGEYPDPEIRIETVPKPVICDYKAVPDWKCFSDSKVLKVSKLVSDNGWVQYTRCSSHCTSETPYSLPILIEKEVDDTLLYEKQIDAILGKIIQSADEGDISLAKSLDIYRLEEEERFIVGSLLKNIDNFQVASIDEFIAMIEQVKEKLQTLGLTNLAIYIVEAGLRIGSGNCDDSDDSD